MTATTRAAEWLAAEPFTLVLSAGFFGFYAHVGVLRALEQADLRPRRVVGTSAGAIAGGLWASGLDAATLAAILADLRQADFWDPVLGPGLAVDPEDPGTSLGLLRGRKFGALLRRVLAEGPGIERIEDCPVSLAVVTHELRRNRTQVLERGPLTPAIRASSALPGLFGPVRIAGRLHADGGIRDRPGFRALAAGERCLYHHLPTRSRWPRITREARRALQPRSERAVLAFADLPPVGPTALELGHEALRCAYEGTLRWLDEPIALAEPWRR